MTCEQTEKTSYTLQINPNSGINPEHLEYCEYLNRLLMLHAHERNSPWCSFSDD